MTPGRARREPKPGRRLAVRPALSVAVADVVVLGRQCRSRPLRRRPHSADHAVLHPLELGLSWCCCRLPRGISAAIGRPSASTRRSVDAARAHRLLRLQHDGLLRPAIHHRHQRASAAIGRAAVRRVVDFCSVPRPADAAPGGRHRPVAHRRRRHHLPRQSRDPARDRVQPRRCLVRDRASDLRVLHRHAAQAAGHASAVVSGRRHGRRRAFAGAGHGSGTRRRPDA